MSLTRNLRRAFCGAALALLVGCGRARPATAVPEDAALAIDDATPDAFDAPDATEVAATADGPDASSPVDAQVETFRSEPVEALLRAMATRSVAEVQSRYNHTHPVFRVLLDDGTRVAVRPATRDRPDLWRNDVAGYVLARQLGIAARVPPVTSRTIPMELLDNPARFRLLHVRGVRPQVAFGSVIYWMPTLLQADIFWGSVSRRWPRWLSQEHPLPEGVPARAEELSTLMVFDALQGNTDRWHPGNLQLDEHRVVVYRDNSEAWREPGRYEPFHLLHQCQRFSRALIAAVRRTDADALRDALAPEEAFGAPILEARDLRRYEARRLAVLAYIDGLIARYGEESVLVWP